MWYYTLRYIQFGLGEMESCVSCSVLSYNNWSWLLEDKADHVDEK